MTPCGLYIGTTLTVTEVQRRRNARFRCFFVVGFAASGCSSDFRDTEASAVGS